MTGPLLDVLGLLAVLALTACAAVFVAAEYSLTTLERMQVETHLRQVGDRRARRVSQAHHSLSFQLSGAQLGITATTLVTGYLAEPAIAGLIRPVLTALGVSIGAAEPIALVIALLVATTLSVVFGELVPKSLAIASPLGTARAVAGVQTLFSTVFRWLINALNRSANWVVRRLGVEPAEELRSARSPGELGSLVRSSAQHGTLDVGTAKLLDRSLRFGEHTAEELMTPRLRVESLDADATVLDLVEASRRTGFSRFPVQDGDLDDVRGVVHVKQAFGVPVARRAGTTVSALCQPVPTVPETLPADTLLDRLRGGGLQIAMVVDEYGGTAGLVTLEDLIEEIVGDVRDEHDRGEAAPVRPLGRNSWIVSGLLRDDEVAEATGFRMPEGEYETLAGMVVARLGRIPDVGDEVRVDGWRITVMRMDRHRVAELRLARAATEAESGAGTTEGATGVLR
ncbi:MAG TPA: hemolysin family protein [Pseudonocardiaceae bacterium]|jgi:CBS domain containing-hemolysin-like protein|nr:hemolysin family protein [Pseudonocardiaceae bacterium]